MCGGVHGRIYGEERYEKKKITQKRRADAEHAHREEEKSRFFACSGFDHFIFTLFSLFVSDRGEGGKWGDN